MPEGGNEKLRKIFSGVTAVALAFVVFVCAMAEAAPPKVYMTKDISAAGLISVYNAL